jgi:hypothetical protein
VRFQSAARPARQFILGLWLQINFFVCSFLPRSFRQTLAQLLRNCCATPRRAASPSSCGKGRCVTELLAFNTGFIAVCIVVITIILVLRFAYRVVEGLVGCTRE